MFLTLRRSLLGKACKEDGFFRVNGQAYLTTRWKTWRIENDGTLTDHALLPPCDGQWNILVEVGNGVVCAENGKARIRYRDATTDSIFDLANHASTEPGPLNNQRKWDVIGLHPGPFPGLCDVVINASEFSTKRGSSQSLVIRHISMDCTTRQSVLVRSAPGNASRKERSLSTSDALFIPGTPGYLSPKSAWHRLPRDPASPSLQLAETVTATESIAASAQRIFSNRPLGTTEERRQLSLRDGLNGGFSRVVMVKGARVSAPSLPRIGDDLVLFDRIDAGIRVIRDAFTRKLPPKGQDIQLREVDLP